MSPTDAILTCFTKSFDFDGRASMSEYWWFWLFRWFLYLCCFLIIYEVPVVCGIVVVLTIIPAISSLVRRLHDTETAGWMLWLVIVPIVGQLVFIWLLGYALQPGDDNPNKYGPPPMKRRESVVEEINL